MTWHLLPARKALVSTAPLPAPLLDGLPHQVVRIKGHPLTVLPHTWDTVSALRSRGAVVPGMSETYRFPGRFPPRDSQRKTVAFLMEHRRAFVLNGLRTGKTLSALWAMDCLKQHGQIRRTLIVAPKSIMQSVWGKEMFLTLPHRPWAILTGSRDKRRKLAQDLRLDVLITNPEGLPLLEGYLPHVDLVIADEATAFKNARAGRSRSMLRMSRGCRLWLMTATPAPQGPIDAHGLLWLQREGKYMSARAFQNLTMQQVSQFKWVARKEADSLIHKEMQPAIRFTAEECYDIPETQTIYQSYDLTPRQAKLAKQFQEEAFGELEGQTITAANAAAAMSKVLQVVAGGVYGHEVDKSKPAFAVDSTPLWESLTEIVTEAEGPVLVFAPFRITAALAHLKMIEAGFRSAVVTAGTTTQQRADIFHRVQTGDLDVMVAIPRTVSHGLDLSRSNTIVWLSPPMSFEQYEQANARISGSGQTRKCAIIHLTANRLTDTLYKRLETKKTLQDAILSLMEDRG